MGPLKILHGAYIVGKASFGIGQISISLAKAQYELKNDVSIWCLDKYENINWAAENHEFPVEHFTGYKLLGPEFLWYSPGMDKQADKKADGVFDIVHQHGMWTGISRATLKFSQKKKTATVIAPHGSLNPYVLSLSKWKKRIALTVYERENLKLASCLHATSENEILDFRKFGLKNPIAYIQNGIEGRYLSVGGNAISFRNEYGISTHKRVLLFLSRISPKKGLPMLVEAISSIRNIFKDWQLIIAGIEEFGHQKEVESLIIQFNLEENIKIIGPLFGTAKHDAFAAAELFILPSHSEGSPMVVLDSLAAGVPVITTKASSWNDLLEFDCGWWPGISTKEIALALSHAVTMSAEDLQRMGEQGKELIASKYTWPQLAQKTILLYEWLLGKVNDKPDFVHID